MGSPCRRVPRWPSASAGMDIMNRQTLVLYGWAMHERFLFHALNGESASESHDEEYRGKIAHDRQAFPKWSQMPNRFSESSALELEPC